MQVHHLPLPRPSNSEVNPLSPHSQSKSNFSFQFVASYVWYGVVSDQLMNKNFVVNFLFLLFSSTIKTSEANIHCTPDLFCILYMLWYAEATVLRRYCISCTTSWYMTLVNDSGTSGLSYKTFSSLVLSHTE